MSSVWLLRNAGSGDAAQAAAVGSAASSQSAAPSQRQCLRQATAAMTGDFDMKSDGAIVATFYPPSQGRPLLEKGAESPPQGLFAG